MSFSLYLVFPGTGILQGKLNTVDLLLLMTLKSTAFIIKTLFTFSVFFFHEEINCTEPSLSVSVPWYTWHLFKVIQSGNPYCRERLNTVDLLVLYGSYQLLFKIKTEFTFSSFCYEEVKHTESSLSVSLPWYTRYLFKVIQSGNPYCRGRLNTVDLLVLTCLDQLLSIIKTFIYFFQNKVL